MRWGLFLACALVAPAYAQSVGGEVALYSAYVWRGFDAAPALSVQPSATAGMAGLSLNAWAAIPVASRDKYEATDEVDLTLSYGRSFGIVRPVVGFIEYLYPNGPKDYTHTEEVFAGVGIDVLLSPTLTAYYDFGFNDAPYISLAVSHSVQLMDALSLSPGLVAGVSGYNDEFGFNDITASVDLNYSFGPAYAALRAGYAYAAERINPDHHAWWAGPAVGGSL